jgi:hypothetical protein
MKLPYDLSGSRAKNRFQNEVLWGIEKLFNVYKNTSQNFIIVFDYVCDIEVHIDDSTLEFYQLKTHNNASPYSQNEITKCAKNKKNSVLGNLFLLKIKDDIKVSIVSNMPFKDSKKKLYSNIEKLEFEDLDSECKDEIKKKLKKELPENMKINFNNLFYIYTSMDLFNPDDSLLGKTIEFFYEIKGEEPKNSRALYMILKETAVQKATYELKVKDYNQLVEKKSITRNLFDEILNKHANCANEAVKKVENLIENEYNSYKDRVKMKNSLTSIIKLLRVSDNLRNIEIKIYTFIKDNIEEFNFGVILIIDIVYNEHKLIFPIEYSDFDKKALILLVLIKYEEGMYE